MSDAPITIEPLGIDNVFFEVDDLDVSIAFYTLCGFSLRWRSEEDGLALFSIGRETHGLLLRKTRCPTGTGCVWVEVRDAKQTAASLDAAGLTASCMETATGITFEVRDPAVGNRVGFADYSREPKLWRS